MDQPLARGEADRAPPPTPALRNGDATLSDAAIVDPAEHNIVFTSLVTSDKDIVGLVAYSLYKQNKYDWLSAFGRLQGRMPDAAEAQSYLYGESTPRRLATYRHLAAAVLDGRGPDVEGPEPMPARGAESAPSPAETFRTLPAATPLPGPSTRQTRRVKPPFQISSQVIVGLCIALGVLLILFWLLHSGAPLPPATPPR